MILRKSWVSVKNIELRIENRKLKESKGLVTMVTN